MLLSIFMKNKPFKYKVKKKMIESLLEILQEQLLQYTLPK
ncbi:hypothetical protein STRDD10_00962 [Streptococcus sp. DD10]|nr:hypothetical protein STRDD10_00962 [Streptococcus sp. DD10]